ncbi:MAG: hypothetical protein NVS2B16_35840 [Chloroflexota bacterium]
MNDDTESARRRPMDTAVLRVYVAEHCGSCHESRRLAKVVSRRLTPITVDVVDVDYHEPVDEIFAIPTFCFRGKILFLGNPREDELIDRVLTLERESVRSGVPCAEAVAVSHRETPGRKNMLIAAWSGALGLVGTLLCSLSMVAPALGLITFQGARSSMAGMSNAGAVSQAQIPGWWTSVMHLGPHILVLSVVLVVLAVAVRRPLATMPAISGGVVLYLGMYVQPGLMTMKAAMVIGTGLLVLAYAASLRPAVGLVTVRFSP